MARPRQAPAGTSRMASLDGMRGIAAFGILILHCWLYTTTVSEKNDSLADGIVHQLRLGVPLFFCLSGFLLYRAWVSAAIDGGPLPRVGDYLRRRARRILPAYWLCLVATVLVLTPLDDTRGVDIPATELLGLFAVFAQNLHPETTGALDPPMWTLAVEVQFYLLLPLLGVGAVWLARRLIASPRAALLAVPAVVIAASVAFNVWLSGRPGSLVASSSLLVALPAFACGMAAAVVFHGRSARPWVAWTLTVTGSALVIFDGAWHEAGGGISLLIWRDLPADAGFAMIIAALPHLRAGLLASRPMLWLGSISFGIYLWHMPVMLFVRGIGVFPEHRPFAAVAIVSALTIPIAWASWTLVERPFVGARRRSAAHERGAAASRGRIADVVRGDGLHGHAEPAVLAQQATAG